VDDRDDAGASAVMVDLVRAWVDQAQRIIILTGAGISTDSGIHDFRGPNGVWTKNPQAEKTATLQHYLADPEIRELAWRTRVESPAFDAQPERRPPVDRALQDRGKLEAVVTQNVDGLHQRAGRRPGEGDRGPRHVVVDAVLAVPRPASDGGGARRVRAGEEDPPCLVCGGILKSDTISFGQQLDEDGDGTRVRRRRAQRPPDRRRIDPRVYPAANVVPARPFPWRRIVIANGEPTGMDRIADAVIRGPLASRCRAILTLYDAIFGRLNPDPLVGFPHGFIP
jgi:NAD-dependent deacetylase